MDQQKRLFLALGLSLAIVFVSSLFFSPQRPAPTTTLTAASVDAGALTVPPVEPGAVAAASPPTEVTDGGVAAMPPPPVVLVTRDSPTTHRTFSSEGGALTKAELQGRKMRVQPSVSIIEGYKRFLGQGSDDAEQMDMGHPVPGAPLPLSLSIDGAQPLPWNTRYRLEGDPGSKEPHVTFVAQVSGWEVQKRLEWDPQSYEARYLITLKNTGPQAVTGELALHYGRFADHRTEEAPNFFGGVGNQSRATCRVAEDNHHLVKPEGPAEFKGPIRNWGIDQQYFLAALYPLEGAREGRCVLDVKAEGRTATAFFPLSVQPGQSVTLPFGLYVGPKDVELLTAVPSSAPAGINRAPAQLEHTVDFGIWAVICKLLLFVLKKFFSLFHNWGVAIILLTVGVKLVLLPLTHKSMVSAEQMKKLQPKMEEIKKKYADDKERQSMEMMKLYQTEKVNPLGGCLPLLIQMPVWIALFTTLRNSYEIYREPFLSPIWTDLTYKDPTYLLPVALGVTMIITQRMQPQMMDAAQARIMTWVMPVFFTAIMLNYPSGLTLYIFTNNVLTIVQQRGLKRYLEHKGIAEKKPDAKKSAALDKKRSTT
jgi:YidC/Oxa1 family membrane protein insertase